MTGIDGAFLYKHTGAMLKIGVRQSSARQKEPGTFVKPDYKRARHLLLTPVAEVSDPLFFNIACKAMKQKWILWFVIILLSVPVWAKPCIDWPKLLTEDATRRIDSQEMIVVVSNFKNDTEEPGQEWLSEGIAQLLTGILSALPGVEAIPETWTPHLSKRQSPKFWIGGLYQNKGGRLRIFVQVRRQPDQLFFAQFPAEFPYPEHVAFFTNLRETAESVANSIGISEFDREVLRAIEQATRSVRAFESASKGYATLNRFDPNAVESGVIWFQEAIKFDIKYVSAYFGLADTYAFLALDRKQKGLPYHTVLQKAEGVLQKLKKILGAEVHYGDRLGSRILAAQIPFASAQAAIHAKQWHAAENALEQTLRLTPFDAQAHFTLAEVYDRLGKNQKAGKARSRAEEMNTCSK